MQTPNFHPRSARPSPPSPASRRRLASARALALVLHSADSTGDWALLSHSDSKAVVRTVGEDLRALESAVEVGKSKGCGAFDVLAAAVGAGFGAQVADDWWMERGVK